ncbi:MAG: hypothetical protein HQL14_07045 [Candidatus Omnitrophica bacterium]|nr:hypothetical protein [Candidatus Omnitrophota bacterium]
MNAVEHIVECYFRYCKGCFTMTDVKIQSGNNRQVDLLAYNLVTKAQYHVESSVTHCKEWSPSTNDLCEIFDKKFLGLPPKREGKNTDLAKGKTYIDKIKNTYQGAGFNLSKINRVFVTWAITDKADLDNFLISYNKKHGIRVSVLSFRDQVLPELLKKISTSNYEDEVLRTLSLLRQYELQIQK